MKLNKTIMKKIILTLVLITLSNIVFAQNIYPTLKIASQNVTNYFYPATDDLIKIEDTSIKRKRFKRKTYKMVSEFLNENGFEFNKTNDTLLVVLRFVDYKSCDPFYVYAKSSMSEMESFDFPNDLEYVKTPLAKENSKHHEYLALFHSGDPDEFEYLFIQRSKYTGFNIAFRVVLNEGVVVDPSYFWEFIDVMYWPESR